MGLLLGGFVLPDGKGGVVLPSAAYAFSGTGTFESLYGTASHNLDMPARSAGDLLVVFFSGRHDRVLNIQPGGWDDGSLTEQISSSITTDGQVAIIVKLATGDSDDEYLLASYVELDGVTPDEHVAFAQMACFSGRPRDDFAAPNSIMVNNATIDEAISADFPTAELNVSALYTLQLLAGGKYLTGGSADTMSAPSGFTMIGSGIDENTSNEALLSGWAYRIVVDGTQDSVPASNWGSSSESGTVNFAGMTCMSEDSISGPP